MLKNDHSISVEWDLDISDVDTNLNKRKDICENYISTARSFVLKVDGEYIAVPGTEAMQWSEDYWTYRIISDTADYNTTFSDLRLGESIHNWIIMVTVRNLADYNLTDVEITVNLYNSSNIFLKSINNSIGDISTGDTANFTATHNNNFEGYLDDVSYAEFTTNYD